MDLDSLCTLLQNDDLSYQFSRSSGPGGQNVNKVNTKVSMAWNYQASTWLSPELVAKITLRLKNRITAEGLLVIHSQKFRSQPRNADDCLLKLAGLLLPLMQVEKPRRPTRPHRGAREKRLREKKAQGEKKSRRSRIEY